MNLTEIKVVVNSRQRMKAAKAWRVFLQLPQDPILPAALTALIEKHVNIRLTSYDNVVVDIAPAYIVDVPNKGRKFQLVAETINELQDTIAPKLTTMVGETVTLAITPIDQPIAPPQTETPPAGDIDEKSLRGLHAVFFKSNKFQDFLQGKTGQYIDSDKSCKDVFKAFMGVESCTQLQQAAYDSMLAEFNQYVFGR